MLRVIHVVHIVHVVHVVRFFILIFSLFLIGNGNANAKSTVFNDVKDLAVMSKQINHDQPNKQDTLVIFDIDDTLLESENFVGSGKWYNWQRGREVSDPKGQLFTIGKKQPFYCIFRTLGTLFEVGSTKLTQPNAVEIFNQLKAYDLMILTARTTTFRSATERELLKHGIELSDKHFPSLKQGLSFELNDTNRIGKVTYDKGIVMSSGLNKGLVLRAILNKAERKYKHIYFIDDSAKNIKQMGLEWDSSPTSLKLFHYTKVSKTISKAEIKASDDAKNHYHNFLNSAFPDQYQAFKSNQCN